MKSAEMPSIGGIASAARLALRQSAVAPTKMTISVSSPKMFPKSRQERLTGFASSPRMCTGTITGSMANPIASRGDPARWSMYPRMPRLRIPQNWTYAKVISAKASVRSSDDVADMKPGIIPIRFIDRM